MKFYLSGPITGREAEAKKQFAKITQALRANGFDIVSPFENGLHKNDPWEAHLAADIMLLLQCDAIIMLPNWKKSLGCRLEREIADRKKMMQIVVIDSDIENKLDKFIEEIKEDIALGPLPGQCIVSK